MDSFLHVVCPRQSAHDLEAKVWLGSEVPVGKQGIILSGAPLGSCGNSWS